MDGQSEPARAFYSSSLSRWQVEFVHDRIGNLPNVKNLVRLVKYWRKTHLPVKKLCFTFSLLMKMLASQKMKFRRKPRSDRGKVAEDGQFCKSATVLGYVITMSEL